MWQLPLHVNVNVCRYARELARHGVEGYSLTECERDYTVGEQRSAAQAATDSPFMFRDNRSDEI
eukprot:COSAG06_NODE_4807_length_3937_cov_1.432960_3_plen_64_part_00